MQGEKRVKLANKLKAIILLFIIILQPTVVVSAVGSVAPDFEAVHWMARIHVFLISFVLMTGGSIIYYFLLRRKRRNQ